jgi:hypothetical protein
VVIVAILVAALMTPVGDQATLRLQWAVPPGDRPEKVSLVPIDVTLPEHLSRAEAIETWTRPVSSRDLEWPALPSGTYQLVLRAGESVADAAPPVGLAEVVLAPGEERVVRVTLPAAEQAQAGSAEIRILIPTDGGEAEHLVLSRWDRGKRTTLATRIERRGGEGVIVTTKAPCSGALLVELPDRIGVVTLDAPCGDILEVPLLRSEAITATLAAPPGAPRPVFGSLRAEKCPGPVPSHTIPFAVDGSRVSTAAPAGCGERTLSVSGFAPVRVSSTQRDLGKVDLTEGAAVAFRVRSARDAEVQRGVHVTAVRAGELASLRNPLNVDDLALSTTVTDAAGWARFSGLPQERIIFLLRAPGRSHPQVTEPYAFRPGEETLLDDFLLEVPANVFVTVSMAEHLKQAVELNEVEIRPRAHNHWPAGVPIRGTLTPAGATLQDVPPGTWTVRAMGRLQNGFVFALTGETIEVAAGVDRHVTLTVTANLFHGRVVRDGAPIRGTINVRPGDETSRARAAVARLGADGEFQVLLEEKGEYAVFVQDAGKRSVTLGRRVTFEDPDKEVVIELPRGRIAGRVVDSTGAPVPDAVVTATQQTVELPSAVSARTSADGRFLLEGVVAGAWEALAESKSARSEPVLLSVSEGDTDGVTLVMDPVSAVKIRVVDGGGNPLRDVSVGAEFLAPGSLEPKRLGGLTRADGEVTLRLSEAQQKSPVNLVVHSMPDGRLSCAVRRLDADQTLRLPATDGEVRLVAPRWARRAGVDNWLVSSTGCAVSFRASVEEEPPHAQAMVFRRLAAGTWSYVQTRTADEVSAVTTGRALRLRPIVTFNVVPGKTTRVVVPAP